MIYHFRSSLLGWWNFSHQNFTHIFRTLEDRRFTAPHYQQSMSARCQLYRHVIYRWKALETCLLLSRTVQQSRAAYLHQILMKDKDSEKWFCVCLENLPWRTVFYPSRQFWDCVRWKSDSLWNFSIVGCQWTVNCLLETTLNHYQKRASYVMF